MLGAVALNDGRFMGRLRAGHVTVRTLNRVVAFTERFPDIAPDLATVRPRRRRDGGPTPRPPAVSVRRPTTTDASRESSRHSGDPRRAARSPRACGGVAT
jgi:hypothetical protein